MSLKMLLPTLVLPHSIVTFNVFEVNVVNVVLFIVFIENPSTVPFTVLAYVNLPNVTMSAVPAPPIFLTVKLSSNDHNSLDKFETVCAPLSANTTEPDLTLILKV